MTREVFYSNDSIFNGLYWVQVFCNLQYIVIIKQGLRKVPSNHLEQVASFFLSVPAWWTEV